MVYDILDEDAEDVTCGNAMEVNDEPSSLSITSDKGERGSFDKVDNK